MSGAGCAHTPSVWFKTPGSLKGKKSEVERAVIVFSGIERQFVRGSTHPHLDREMCVTRRRGDDSQAIICAVAVLKKQHVTNEKS